MGDRTTRWPVVLVASVAALLLATSCAADDDAADAEESSDANEVVDSADEPERDFSAVADTVAEFVEAEGLNGAGLVVVRADDGIVYEDYWGEFDADRVSLLASTTKMLTAGVLLHLADEGLLEMDTPVTDQVDWGGESPITPAQLVSNSSGLVGLLPDPTYAPYLCQYVFEGQGDLEECGRSILLSPEDDADVVPPDTRFDYGGGQWQVAGAVAEAVSGRTWAELVDEIYVEPCGVESLGYNSHFTQLASDDPFEYPPGFDGDPSVLAPTENPNMEAGAYIAPPDYAALLLMHLEDGMCGDSRVLSTDALELMHNDRVGPVYGGDAGVDRDGPQETLTEDGDGPGELGPRGYGMGWWVDRETGRIDDPGSFGAVATLDLDAGYGSYLIIEKSSELGIGLSRQIADGIDEALDAA